MRLTFTFLLVLGVLGGCTALQDLDQFQEDPSCGVDIRLRQFFPHAQEPDGTSSDISRNSQIRERFGVYVVQERRPAGGEFRRFYVARAFFDPLPAPNVDIRLPFAVEASESGDELPATLELHADRQTLREGADFFEISEISDDHSWILPHACGAEGILYPHNSDFDQLQAAVEGAFGLKVLPTTNDQSQFWVDTTIEVRVVRETIIDGAEVEQARAFYRRGRATDIENAGLDEAEIEVGEVLREDENVSVIVFFDRNDNGIFDEGGPDLAFEYDVEPADGAIPRCEATAEPVCLGDDNEINVEVSLDPDDVDALMSPRSLMVLGGPTYHPNHRRMRFFSLHLAIVVIVCVACGSETERAEARETQPRVAESNETAVEAAHAVAPEAEAEAEAEEDEPPTPEELEAAAADLEETVVDAIEAATRAETGSTYCESAFEGMAAMIARVAAQYPDDTRPVPPQRAFMSVCERLSQDAQQCLVPSYATEHVAECRVVADAIPEEDRRRLQEVLTSQ